MRPAKPLPVGIEFFEEMRREGFYYIDKTGMIKELIDSKSKVSLFTRPRRFGKSLNMNMLKHFFEYGCDPQLFEGLAISAEPLLCQEHMGKYPVISITLKDVNGNDYETALGMLRTTIGKEAMRFQFLLDSDVLTDLEKAAYEKLVTIDTTHQQFFSMSQEVLASGLLTLCNLLHKHYGQKVILLIDEYDVPLDKAQNYGYYDQMVSLIRSLFSQALKTNHSLALAVLTGCLRVSRESIFTGLNNLKVLSITNLQSDERFGFTDGEVRAMAEYYGCGDRFDMIKEWYDGYCFGSADIYCPWDVINYVYLLRAEPDARPRTFWINSSSNAVIRSLLQKADDQTMEDLDRLVNGMSVTKTITEELTYRELYDNIDNLWSVLFATGYLTKRAETDLNTYEFVIPNQEIRIIFRDQILSWFQEEARKDAPALDAFCEAFRTGNAPEIERVFSSYLKQTISIRDTFVRKEKKENFYHGILLGLLSSRRDWVLASNAESGEGYSDILVKIKAASIGIVIELKYSESRNLEAACLHALEQIEQKNYAERLLDDGMTAILKYGIACHRQTCMVRMAADKD